MKECYIIAGGQSVADYDIVSINKDIIAVNHALQLRPDAKYFVGLDTKIHIDLKNELKEYKGIVFYDRKIQRYDNVKYYWFKQISVFSEFLPYVYCENNSGIAALNIAYILGYRKINMIGYDFEGVNFHTGIKDDYFNRILPKVNKRMKNYAKYYVNCNTDSKLLKYD